MDKKIVFVILVSFLFSSCATLFKGTRSKVDFASTPPRADVYVNGNLMGKTPIQLKLAVNREYQIEFRKEGYQPRIYQISNRVGAGWVVLDVIAGLVPVIIDAVTGAWYHLDQKNINAVLEKQQPKPVS